MNYNELYHLYHLAFSLYYIYVFDLLINNIQFKRN